MMMASQLDVGPFGEIATGEMLASGFHPIFARHTPNGARLHLERSEGGRVEGKIVTKWDGSALSTPVVLEGGQDAQSVVSKWCKVVSDITNPVGDDEGVDVVVGALVTAQQPPPEGTFSLQVGDFVAYLIPDIPACHQTHFIVTQVVSLQPFALANNHHASLFASGMGEVARYNPATERVVFPVKNLRDVI
jgi:hypothetical protein